MIKDVGLEIRLAIENDHLRDILQRYSQWLDDCGYMDNDWWCEDETSVDRFMKEELTVN